MKINCEVNRLPFMHVVMTERIILGKMFVETLTVFFRTQPLIPFEISKNIFSTFIYKD